MNISDNPMAYRTDIKCEDKEGERSHWSNSWIYWIIGFFAGSFIGSFATLIGYWAWKIVMVGFYASFSTDHATAYALYMNDTGVLATTMPQ